jgi:hypothetical protein
MSGGARRKLNRVLSRQVGIPNSYINLERATSGDIFILILGGGGGGGTLGKNFYVNIGWAA